MPNGTNKFKCNIQILSISRKLRNLDISLLEKQMKLLNLLLFLTISFPQFAIGSDIEYALKIRKLNPEYGKRIPKELCDKEIKSPCRLAVHLLYNVVSKIEDTKENLGSAAYSALKRNAKRAQVVWEFNLCKPLWDKNIPCAEVLGYLVIKDNQTVFYAFQIPKKYF